MLQDLISRGSGWLCQTMSLEPMQHSPKQLSFCSMHKVEGQDLCTQPLLH